LRIHFEKEINEKYRTFACTPDGFSLWLSSPLINRCIVEVRHLISLQSVVCNKLITKEAFNPLSKRHFSASYCV
jgi:hypothetical protein